MRIAPSSSLDPSLLPYDGVTDLLGADPSEVAALASGFGAIASTAGNAATALRGGHGKLVWEGQAADSFRRNLYGIPPDLDKIHESYSQAANALNSYERELAGDQSQLVSILNQLETAKAAVDNAQIGLSGAQSALSSARANHSVASGMTRAQSGVTVASSALSGAQQHFQNLQARGWRIVDNFTAARRAASLQLQSAGAAAPRKPWYDVLLGDIENLMKEDLALATLGPLALLVPGFAKEVGEFEFDILKAFVGTVIDAVELPYAVVEVALHPTSLAAWERFGTDLAAAASIALLATGIGEAALAGDVAEEAAVEGAEAGAEAAAEGGEEAAASSSKLLNAFQAVNKLGDSTQFKVANFALGQANEAGTLTDDAEQGKWKQFGVDLGADAVGTALGQAKIADKLAGTEGAEGAVNAFNTWEKGMSGGKSMAGALTDLSSEQRSLLLTAAGRESGSLSGFTAGENQQFLKSISGHALEQSSLNAKATATVIDHGIDAGVDGSSDFVVDKIHAGDGESGG
jgi:uncharacterized protein YukE